MTDRRRLEQRAEKKQLTTMTRHVLVCVDDDCDGSSKLAKHFKKAIAAAGIRASVSTSKVKCLGICKGGPIVLVYPEGTWYAGVTDTVVDRIVDQHLNRGEPVAEHLFLRNPLCGDALMSRSA
jgi:(2Fe-2S) ferredoxin